MSKFEEIDDGDVHTTYRLKVLGGWLIKHKDWSGDCEVNVSIVFLPDAEHKWEIE